MEIIETQRHRRPDFEELKMFLGACRDAAEEDAHYKIASISLQTRSLDPLAVLESIYERGSHHFYIEHPRDDWALAGAEPVVIGEFSGPDRASKVKAWADEVLEHSVAVGDHDAPFSGPHFYAGLAFSEKGRDGAVFPPATVYLPRWQVARRGEETTAVANFRVDARTDLEALTTRLWAAYEKFTTFAYDKAPTPEPSVLQSQAEVGPIEGYAGRVSQALEFLATGVAKKVVMARAVDYTFDRPFRPLVTLAGLRERFRHCYAFSFENGQGQSLIGASPERLVAVRTGRLQTEALAGTAARGRGAQADARAGQALLASDKDRREHAHVVESIQRRLAGLGITMDSAQDPDLYTLPNVLHLRTPLTAQLPASVHLLEVVGALHPTPAVGGVPRDAAVDFIEQLEPFHRELYAGAIGYFDHRGEGEFIVGLRSGLVDGPRARLYAGAGIVLGSDPEAEFNETEMKFDALRVAIAGAERA